MASQAVVLNLPDSLYERVAERARQAHRSVEDELLEVVATAVPSDESLPEDLQATVAQLQVLDDASPWRAARSHLPRAAAARLEALNHKRGLEGLTPSEQEMLATLVREYERYMLIRARAAALLHERGHDVSGLLAPS